MPQKTIIYWRDIPTQVIISAGRKKAKRQLTERFEQAADMAAMRSGQRESDDYLSHMRRSDPVEVEGDDLEALVEEAAAALETEFDAERLKELIANGGSATT